MDVPSFIFGPPSDFVNWGVWVQCIIGKAQMLY